MVLTQLILYSITFTVNVEDVAVVYRDKKGRSRQKIVANLGQVEKLQDEDELDRLVDKLRKYCKGNFSLPEEIKGESIPLWGPCLIARTLWDRIGMPEILFPLLKKANRRDLYSFNQ